MRKWKIKAKILDWGLKDGDPRRDTLPKEDEVIVEEDYLKDLDKFDPNDFGHYKDDRDEYAAFYLNNAVQDRLTEKHGVTGDDMDNYFGHEFDMFIESMELVEDAGCWRVVALVDERGEWKVSVRYADTPTNAELESPSWTMRGVIETSSLEKIPKALSLLSKSAGCICSSESLTGITVCGVSAIKEWKARIIESPLKPGYRKEFKK
jgi:hypothetical protein